MDKPSINIQLEKEAALVLFDFLDHYNDTDPNLDPAHQHALWQLEAALEKTLVEPFQENYTELIAQAKKSILGEENSWTLGNLPDS